MDGEGKGKNAKKEENKNEIIQIIPGKPTEHNDKPNENTSGYQEQAFPYRRYSESVSSGSSENMVERQRNVTTTENEDTKPIELIFVILSCILMMITFPISIFMCVIVLQEYQRAVILRLGRLRPGGARGPGMVFILPCVDRYSKIDLRTTSLDMPPQDILTKDSVTISVEAVIYYRIKNPLDTMLQVMDPQSCCELLAMTTLRNITGGYMLIELVSSKKALSKQIKATLESTGATEPWGIRIERVEITDIYMPEALQRAMAVEQEARREAMAKVAAANGERDAVRALKEAADIMETNPIALHLRYLQTLNTIANENTESIVFPFPIDVVQKLIK